MKNVLSVVLAIVMFSFSASVVFAGGSCPPGASCSENYMMTTAQTGKATENSSAYQQAEKAISAIQMDASAKNTELLLNTKCADMALKMLQQGAELLGQDKKNSDALNALSYFEAYEKLTKEFSLTPFQPEKVSLLKKLAHLKSAVYWEERANEKFAAGSTYDGNKLLGYSLDSRVEAYKQSAKK